MSPQEKREEYGSTVIALFCSVTYDTHTVRHTACMQMHKTGTEVQTAQDSQPHTSTNGTDDYLHKEPHNALYVSSNRSHKTEALVHVVHTQTHTLTHRHALIYADMGIKRAGGGGGWHGNGKGMGWGGVNYFSPFEEWEEFPPQRIPDTCEVTLASPAASRPPRALHHPLTIKKPSSLPPPFPVWKKTIPRHFIPLVLLNDTGGI